MKETPKQGGYRYLGFCKQTREHSLINKDGKIEQWLANKSHASYGLIYKNTHLEFSHSLN